jgi:hypothetical protein
LRQYFDGGWPQLLSIFLLGVIFEPCGYKFLA